MTRCDYKKPGCSNDGLVIGVEWMCVKHIASQRALIEQQSGVIQRQWDYIEQLKQTISGHEQAGMEGLIRDYNDHQRIEQQAREIAGLKEICERVAEEVMDYLNTANVNGKPDEPELWQAVERMKEAHRQEISRLREDSKKFADIVLDRMNTFGNWEDGCFYYNRTCASELQEVIDIAKTLKEEHS